MSDWTDGYRAALADFERLVEARGIATDPMRQLLSDLVQDALVIEHEQGNRLLKRRLSAVREAERGVKQGALL